MEQESKSSKYIKMIDIYGKRITLRFDGDEYFTTNCGACATIILVVSLIIMFTFNSISTYNGKIANFTYMIKNNVSKLQLMNAKSNSLTSSQETFAFAFES
jgi:hypothetical protein